jgi:hypothetical protein
MSCDVDRRHLYLLNKFLKAPMSLTIRYLIKRKKNDLLTENKDICYINKPDVSLRTDLENQYGVFLFFDIERFIVL